MPSFAQYRTHYCLDFALTCQAQDSRKFEHPPRNHQEAAILKHGQNEQPILEARAGAFSYLQQAEAVYSC